MQIDRKYTLETLARLVQTNSINPMLAPGAPGEKEIATFVAESLGACGLTVETFEPAPGRTSVLGRLTGTGGGRTLMRNAHAHRRRSGHGGTKWRDPRRCYTGGATIQRLLAA
jgi:acetylornithine deacetylase